MTFPDFLDFPPGDFEWFLKPGVSNQVGKSPGKDMKDLFPGVTTITITLVNRVYSVNT